MSDRLLGGVKEEIQGLRPLNLIIADNELDYCEDVCNFLKDNPAVAIRPIGTVNNCTDLNEFVSKTEVEVILLAIELADSEVCDIRALMQNDRQVIILTGSLDDQRIMNLKRLGLTVFYKYSKGSELIKCIRGEETEGVGLESGPDGETDQKQKLLVVHSPKGGTGKSTLAVNLGLQYARKGLKTIIVDLAMYGSIGAFLKIPHRGRGLGSLIALLEQDDYITRSWRFADHVRSAIVSVQVDSGKLDVLVAATPVKMDKLTVNITDTIFDVLKAEGYDVILVDTSSDLSERVVTAMRKASKIILLTTPDVACGWNLVQLKDIFKSVQVAREKVALIINRFSEDLWFNVKELEEVLGFSVAGQLQENYKVVQGLSNQGIPLALRDGNPLNNSFKLLANSFYEIYSDKELKQGSRLKNLFSFSRKAK